ncbi:MAG: hypothetical protein FWG84_10395 [Bacteroidales bacterium]|nr:hypothetical protein [Bacteroidales bacterium]
MLLQKIFNHSISNREIEKIRDEAHDDFLAYTKSHNDEACKDHKKSDEKRETDYVRLKENNKAIMD